MKMSYISFSIERIFSNVIPLKVGRRKFWKIILSALIKWYKVWTSLFEEFSKSLIKRRSKAIYFRFAFHPRRFRSIILKLSKYGKSSLLDSSEKGAKFYICFFNNFHNLGQKSQRKNSMRFLLKRRILRREILLSLPVERKSSRSFVRVSCNITLALKSWNSRPRMRESRELRPRFRRSTLLASFFLSCGFLSDLLEPPRGWERIVN